MIELNLTPDERKVLAYACGFALRPLEEGEEAEKGLSGLVRQRAAAALAGRLRDLLSKLAADQPATLQVQLENDTAYSIASCIEWACAVFKVEFLDWRTFRHYEPDLVIASFASLLSVWKARFNEMIDQPDVVDLIHWDDVWQSLRLELLRAFGREDPQGLRQVLETEYELRSLRQTALDASLRLRAAAIRDRRQELLGAFVAHFAQRLLSEAELECPTCSTSIQELVCRGCAEVFFPIEHLDSESPAFRHTLSTVGRDELKLILRASIGWALLNDIDHTSDGCTCDKCHCGDKVDTATVVCQTCGFVHVTAEQVKDDPLTWIMLLQEGRRRRIAYNLANGVPSFKTFGASDLTDQGQLEEATRRRTAETLENSQKLRQYIKQVVEIAQMAGLE
jgi:hypothetical protein